jgi:hypothetical protein
MDNPNFPSNKQIYKYKGRGHSPEISIRRERNKIPSGEPFIWLTLEMLQSPAWRALPPAAKGVIERVIVEHLEHAGKDNGRLPVTYVDFEAHGVPRRAIKFGIEVAVALGFIDVAEKGCSGAGDTRRAARYALTWVDRHDGAPRSNRWKSIGEEAKGIMKRISSEDTSMAWDRRRNQPQGYAAKAA